MLPDASSGHHAHSGRSYDNILNAHTLRSGSRTILFIFVSLHFSVGFGMG
jgi:hypothetical protein